MPIMTSNNFDFNWQVSHAIGDFYLKLQEFQDAPLHAKFRLPVPLREAALSSEPTLLRRTLNPHSDKFVVLASDGLYEYLDNQETVDLVNKYPREVKELVHYTSIVKIL